ncbi:hypothetical protein BKA81DRAFT_359261 [Phyllosticta paracitricarpa]
MLAFFLAAVALALAVAVGGSARPIVTLVEPVEPSTLTATVSSDVRLVSGSEKGSPRPPLRRASSLGLTEMAPRSEASASGEAKALV